EPPRTVIDSGHATADRRPVDVDVERRKKDGDLQPLARWVRGSRGRAGHHHASVSGRNDQTVTAWDPAFGVAEKVGKERPERRKAGGPPVAAGTGQNGRRHERACYERITCLVDVGH